MEIAGWIGTLSPAGVLAVAVILILSGKLIPEKVHDKIVGALREAKTIAEVRAERAEAQVERLTGTLGTHSHLLESIRDAATSSEERKC